MAGHYGSELPASGCLLAQRSEYEEDIVYYPKSLGWGVAVWSMSGPIFDTKVERRPRVLFLQCLVVINSQ